MVRWPKRCVPLSVLVANDVFGEIDTVRSEMGCVSSVLCRSVENFHVFHELSMSNKFAINVRRTSRTPYECQKCVWNVASGLMEFC